VNPKIIILVLFGGLLTNSSAWAAEPVGATDIPITFSKKLALPEPPRLPQEVIQQPPRAGEKEDGIAPLVSLAREKITAVDVTWADPWFRPESEVHDFLQGLLSSQNEGYWSYHVWSFGDGTPDLVATVKYASGKQGKWWIWCVQGLRWAFQDDRGHWWFGLWNPSMNKIPKPKSLAEFNLRALDILKSNEEASGSPPYEILDYINSQGAHDPAVIDFFQVALVTRGDEAINDLWSPSPGIWDDSFLEPVVHLIEKCAAKSKPANINVAQGKHPWMVMENALDVLERHHSVWAGDASIPPRLSKAVLTLFPSFKDTAKPNPPPGDQMWCNVVRMLAQTHDRAMIAVLRPFLKDKVVAGDGAVEGGEPLRACDEAAMAIKQLLGDKTSEDDQFVISGVGVGNVRDSYPEWDEWDKRIVDLQKRLDGLPEK
jgi:hypothetical protein